MPRKVELIINMNTIQKLGNIISTFASTVIQRSYDLRGRSIMLLPKASYMPMRKGQIYMACEGALHFPPRSIFPLSRYDVYGSATHIDEYKFTIMFYGELGTVSMEVQFENWKSVPYGTDIWVLTSVSDLTVVNR